MTTQELSEALERLDARRKRVPNPRKPIQPPTNCIPDCPICGGIGWVRFDVAITDPSFGKLQPCPNIDIYKAYSGWLGISETDKSLTWDDIIVREKPLALAITQIQKVLARGYGWVYLYGSYGKAKSLLLKIAISECLRSKKLAAYVRMAEFVDNLRSAFDEKNPSYELQSRLDWWTKLPILAIDELEKVNMTGFAKEKMFLLFDKRYEDATDSRKGITLMASNMPPAGLDPYLTDRIRDGRFSIIELAGESFRPKNSYGEDY